MRQTEEIVHEKRNLMKETESLLRVVQNNTTKTNYMNMNIHSTQQNSKCRLCGEKDERVITYTTN